jgi:hypothetical protein
MFTKPLLGWQSYTKILYATIKIWNIIFRVYIHVNEHEKLSKGVSMIRVDFGPISETVYIDIILNTIIER